MRRIGMLGLSFLLLVVMLAVTACGKNEGNAEVSKTPDVSDTSDTGQPAGEKVSLTVFTTLPSYIKDLETNTFTKLLEEKFNIDFTWDVTTEPAVKKPLILTSGDYPEIFYNIPITKYEQLKYGKDGIFIPLNDLIDQYAPNFKKAMAEISYLRGDITAPDGNIYALPAISECLQCNYAQKYWINTAWLKQVGMEMPTTTDQFYEVLKAFKEQDPNQNGQHDEIPLSGATNGWHTQVTGFLMNAFIYNNSSNYFTMENGTIDMAANKPGWQKGLQYMNRLYTEGLIDPEAFTQDNNQLQAKVNNKPDPRVGVVAVGAYNNVTIQSEEEKLREDFDAVPPLVGPDGVQLTGYFGGIASSLFAITDKATKEQQIAAIKFVDYLYSEEGTLFSQFGPNQEFWKPAEQGELDFNGNQAKYKFDNAALNSAGANQNDSWSNYGVFNRSAEFNASDVGPQDIYALDASQVRLYKETINKYVGKEPKEVPPASLFVDPADVDELSQLSVQINDYITTSMLKFITGQMDVEKGWDTYVKGLDNLNLARYLEINNNAQGN